MIIRLITQSLAALRSAFKTLNLIDVILFTLIKLRCPPFLLVCEWSRRGGGGGYKWGKQMHRYRAERPPSLGIEKPLFLLIDPLYWIAVGVSDRSRPTCPQLRIHPGTWTQNEQTDVILQQYYRRCVRTIRRRSLKRFYAQRKKIFLDHNITDAAYQLNIELSLLLTPPRSVGKLKASSETERVRMTLTDVEFRRIIG